jgi:hypothetical protein
MVFEWAGTPKIGPVQLSIKILDVTVKKSNGWLGLVADLGLHARCM